VTRPGQEDAHAAASAASPAEAKRLEARRQFLRGAGAAVPVVLTFGVREARAASASICASLGLAVKNQAPNEAPPYFACKVPGMDN